MPTITITSSKAPDGSVRFTARELPGWQLISPDGTVGSQPATAITDHRSGLVESTMIDSQ